MPSTSAKQANFMAACAHGAGYASCPPAKVSHDFNQADKGRGIIGRKRGGMIEQPLASASEGERRARGRADFKEAR